MEAQTPIRKGILLAVFALNSGAALGAVVMAYAHDTVLGLFMAVPMLALGLLVNPWRRANW